MKVYKFGGASVSTTENIKRVAGILRLAQDEKLLVVISAMGKTTNALEKVAEAFFAERKEEALQLFAAIKEQHLTIANELLVHQYKDTASHLADFFTEVEWLLHDKPVQEYDYYYDQIVCIGELLSTAIMSAFFREEGIVNTWTDIRDILRTDDNFREAAIDWTFSLEQTNAVIRPLLDRSSLIVTQGFIGSTDENESTTLGREGSDYTAAVFANMLDAESLTIWKDVEGVMNADPKAFADATYISELNYKEVMEMAYYGAQVIHPKTIKPLQNKSIPMYVKCFLDSSLPGTYIHNKTITRLPPIIVLKKQQVMVELSSLDFSFVGAHELEQIYHTMERLHLWPNLTQKGAISFRCLLNDHPERIEKMALALSGLFEVHIEKGLELLTLRHYTTELANHMMAGRTVVLRQQSPEMLQAVMR